MNSDLVRKNLTQFNLLKLRASQDQFGLLTIQFKQKTLKMKSRTHEIHTNKEEEHQTTTIRIFS
jgi:hypothetical protein